MRLTLDIPMKFALRMQVLETFEQLFCDDGYILLPEDARLELQESWDDAVQHPAVVWCSERGASLRTISEQEPPEQYSMMIQRLAPFKNEP